MVYEKPYQILDECRNPLPMKTSNVAKIDSEYVRNGTVSIFCFVQPHSGRILHAVESTRTAVDWAEKIKYLVDEIGPNSKKIILVMDNLNTHSLASLYKAFPPEEARRIARRLKVHYTPKHGSWLDIAEIGINVMTRECLNRRIPSIDAFKQELKAWNEEYDKDPSPVNWQFVAEDSRIKLKILYPDIAKNRRERDERQAAKPQ
ncbi:transposase [Oribacterium sp. NK2B42]|uniref:transposase n=1 Tax=Oribacterium sp. NK2B42 TaxID=689781 RepID=UPI000422FE99|nr:transposase [Oribacterium sp. NK2B42]